MTGNPPTEFTLGHWGTFEVERDASGEATIRPWRGDGDAPAVGLDQLTAQMDSMRIRRPSFRESWLRDGPGAATERRGSDRFVEVGWDEAIQLLADELNRVIARHGNGAIFGGSYGWGSAGRFHHAQSQLHRFLNIAGGYVRSRDTYSYGAANVVMPHIAGTMESLLAQHTDWNVLADNTTLFVGFGGLPVKNSQMTAGGPSRHRLRREVSRMARSGCRFVNISPLRGDVETAVDAEWIPIRPNTDTALMLGLAHQLLVDGRHARDFLQTRCAGFDRVERYLRGVDDGCPKTAEWAAAITGVPRDRIVSLAREMSENRTMLNASWSLQRQRHGEQPYWALVTLACMLGQVGLAGGGFGLGYGAMNSIGSAERRLAGPVLPQGRNPVGRFIPVARIADMLLNPGKPFRYNGGTHAYPDIRLIYWAGGNPFHHHQDLNRLLAAWRRPETIVVHDQFWTASAKSADIVLPVNTTLEREDIGYAPREGQMLAMRKVRPPFAESRSDFAIFSALARCMGVGARFTEGLDERGWLRRLYDDCRQRAASTIELPDFETFWEQGRIELGATPEPVILLGAYRADPAGRRLPTPSGRIELFSETVAGFGDPDCPGHAAWLPPEEWLGADQAKRFPLHLLTNQPSRRLHSQLDHGPYSRAGKVAGREPVTMHRLDAAERGIAEGDLVRIFNQRGACLAGAVLSDDIHRGVVVMATGAWFDPAAWSPDNRLEKHGNPNVLTRDVGTSALAQACSALSCLVDIVRHEDEAPRVTAHQPPAFRAGRLERFEAKGKSVRRLETRQEDVDQQAASEKR